jgi:hypothetical protein
VIWAATDGDRVVTSYLARHDCTTPFTDRLTELPLQTLP